MYSRHVLRYGWLSTSLTAAFTGALLAAYGVSWVDIALFTLYMLVVVTIPGTLVWRALRGRPGPIAADLAAGTAVGYPLTIFTYLIVRVAGVPQLGIAAPIAIVCAFALVPHLRRHWHGSGERVPMWWSWALCGIFAALLLWSAASFFRYHGLTWPGNSTPYPDMPFHLALAAELKHHFPAMMPYLQDEPLRYHWFIHAHMAATSWGTGIELQILLLRLAVVPMLAIVVTGVAFAARSVVGAWWSGPVTVLIALFSASPFGLTTTGTPMRTLWLSPMQTLGAAIFAVLVLLLVDLLKRAPSMREWLLFGILVAGVAGAKATYLPMLVAAVALVAAVEFVTRRSVSKTTVIAFGVTLLIFVAAMLLLYRGTSGGMQISPLKGIRQSGRPVAYSLALYVLGWLVAWAGLAGLAVRGRKLMDPAIVFCLGMAAAGIGAILLTTQPGSSQVYFLNSARPYIAIAATAGIVALTQPLRERRRAATYGLAAFLGLVMAFGAASSYLVYKPMVTAWHRGFRHYPTAVGQIPRGGVTAARWLRDHSGPDELVATNVHCLLPATQALAQGTCDTRSFWISAYAERRVLLEGWAYTTTASKLAGTVSLYVAVPYWRPQVLADNDAAFASPSVATVNMLRDRYGVRWLFVDTRIAPATAALAAVADLRLQDGAYAVYQIRR
jgi:hypothetical protein